MMKLLLNRFWSGKPFHSNYAPMAGRTLQSRDATWALKDDDFHRCDQALWHARTRMDGGMVTMAFATQIAVSKFAWHLPLNRHAQMLASCGVVIDRGTLGTWVMRVAWWLELLYDALTAFIRSQPRVFCDETPSA